MDAVDRDLTRALSDARSELKEAEAALERAARDQIRILQDVTTDDAGIELFEVEPYRSASEAVIKAIESVKELRGKVTSFSRMLK